MNSSVPLRFIYMRMIWRFQSSFLRIAVSRKVVQYRLPTLLLKFAWILAFRLKILFNEGAGCFCSKAHGNSAVIIEVVGEKCRGFYCVELSFEVEAKAAVAGFHAVGEAAARVEVVLRSGTKPIVAGEIPARHMLGLGKAVPHRLNRSLAVGLDGNKLGHKRRLLDKLRLFYCESQVAGML